MNAKGKWLAWLSENFDLPNAALDAIAEQFASVDEDYLRGAGVRSNAG